MKRACEHCGAAYAPHRSFRQNSYSTQKYCSTRCRRVAHRRSEQQAQRDLKAYFRTGTYSHAGSVLDTLEKHQRRAA